MIKNINVLDYSKEILAALKTGVLLTTKNEDKVNTMTISWGSLGIEWNTPIFTVYVREGRYTRENLDATSKFTINIPLGEFNRKILAICGQNSGRDMDKIKECELTLVDSPTIDVPGFKEFALTLECEVVHKQLQGEDTLDKSLLVHYPQDVESTYPGSNRNFHIAYYGKIVNAYIVE